MQVLDIKEHFTLLCWAYLLILACLQVHSAYMLTHTQYLNLELGAWKPIVPSGLVRAFMKLVSPFMKLVSHVTCLTNLCCHTLNSCSDTL